MTVYCRDQILASNVWVASGFFDKLIGLISKKKIDKSEGLLLKNCWSVHSFFMKFPIDVIYLSGNMQILTFETLHPWKVGSLVKNTEHILELSAGSFYKKASVGDFLKLEN